MIPRTSTSTRIACPGKCGDKEDCFVHQESMELIKNKPVFSNHTYCNNCGYEASQLVVPANYTIVRIGRV